MKLNAPRNQPQTNYCNPYQQVSKPMPKERLQMPTSSQPTAPTRQGPTYDQLANEVNILRAANVELQRRMGLNRLTIINQNAKICAMDRTIKGLMANNRPAPRTKVQLRGSHGPQPAQQQPTPKTSPDSQVAFFNEEYDFSAAYHDANTLVAPLAPPMIGNGQFHPYAHNPFAASFTVGTHHNKLSGPSDLAAGDGIFLDYSLDMPSQAYTLPTANAPVAAPSKPALLPVTDGKLVDDASVPPLSLKAAAKPAQRVATTLAAAPAQVSTATTTTHQPLGAWQVSQGTQSIDELYNETVDFSPDIMGDLNGNTVADAPSQESTTTLQQPAQQERQATPAADSLETQMADGIFDFLNEEMFE